MAMVIRNYSKGLSIKDVRTQGGGVVQCGHFVDKGVLQMRMSALFGAKTSDFLKFMVSARTREAKPLRTFYGTRGEGGNNLMIRQ